MPTEAICVQIKYDETVEMYNTKLHKLDEFLQWLCINNMPHNLFITPERNKATKALNIFVFVRQEFCFVKDVNTLNVGFCELAGYVPVGSKYKILYSL